jgi:hypothetical protein
MLGTVIISLFSVAYWISVHSLDISCFHIFQWFSTALIVSSYVGRLYLSIKVVLILLFISYFFLKESSYFSFFFNHEFPILAISNLVILNSWNRTIFPWICFSVIYYLLSRIPAMSNYFSFPLRVRDSGALL